MTRLLGFGALVVLAATLVACGQVQSFESSTRSGDRWGTISPEEIEMTALAVSPDVINDGTLFVGLHGWDMGVFRSTDRGDTWHEVYEGLRGNSAPWVVVSPNFSQDGTLFVGRGNGGLYRSTNRGESWKKTSEGLPRYQDFGECCGYYKTMAFVFSPILRYR